MSAAWDVTCRGNRSLGTREEAVFQPLRLDDVPARRAQWCDWSGEGSGRSVSLVSAGLGKFQAFRFCVQALEE